MIVIDEAELEGIIGEAIALAAWGAGLGLKCGSHRLWAGRAATPAGIEWAMGRVRAASKGYSR